MCITELFGNLIDIVSLVFVLIDLSCCPCGTAGLEEYAFVRAFKILTGIELEHEDLYKKFRAFIVKCVFIPLTVIPVFLMNLVESVLLIKANESFLDISSSIFYVHVLLIISLYIMLVYLILMMFFAYGTDELQSIKFHQLCMLSFHSIDLVINILMLVECFLKTIQPGLNMIFIIFVLSAVECFCSVTQLVKSLIFYLACYEGRLRQLKNEKV